MKIKLSPSTRMGLQASVSIAIATLLGYFLPIERPYWAILTAMLLISQTWGESIKRSFERVLMTIIGGAVGTFLFFLTKSYPPLPLILLLTSVFFVVYFIQVSYLVTVFFITVFVVFLFAALQGWNAHLLMIRIYETLLGAGIAIITSALVFPIRAHCHFQNKLYDFVYLINHSLDDNFKKIFSSTLNKSNIKKQHALILSSYMDLQKSSQAMQFENLFKNYPKQKFKDIMLNLNVLMHYTTSALQISPTIMRMQDKSLIQNEFQAIHLALKSNLDLLGELFAGKKSQRQWIDVEPIRIKARQILLEKEDTATLKKLDWLELHSYFYFIMRMNEVIAALQGLLTHQAPSKTTKINPANSVKL